MILIKNGRVIDPKSGTDGIFDVVIKDGKIADIGKFLENSSYEKIIDAKNMVVAPGLIDVHVHFRDPGLTYKEDLTTGSRAAAAGGFTTVVCMANTKPPVDSVEIVKDICTRASKLPIRVLTAATVTKGMEGKELTDMDALFKAGAVGFTDDGRPIMDAGLALRAMKKTKELGVPISFHEEDPSLIGSPGVNAGPVAEAVGVKGAPGVSEQVLVARDGLLAIESGARIDIQHVSSKLSVEIIAFMKKLGADIYAEVTPQHFSLTDEIVLKKGALGKLNPPIRTEEDRYALINGLADGTIDMIVTDHAPHSAEEKSRGIAKAPSGMIGLETSLALGITNLVRKGYLTLPKLLEKMTVNPARLYNLDAGELKKGARADIVIFDDKEQWKVQKFFSKSSNSPFIGLTLKGKVKYTICNGRVVYNDKEEKIE